MLLFWGLTFILRPENSCTTHFTEDDLLYICLILHWVNVLFQSLKGCFNTPENTTDRFYKKQKYLQYSYLRYVYDRAQSQNARLQFVGKMSLYPHVLYSQTLHKKLLISSAQWIMLVSKAQSPWTMPVRPFVIQFSAFPLYRSFNRNHSEYIVNDMVDNWMYGRIDCRFLLLCLPIKNFK